MSVYSAKHPNTRKHFEALQRGARRRDEDEADERCIHLNVRRTELRAAETVVFVDCADCGVSLRRE